MVIWGPSGASQAEEAGGPDQARAEAELAATLASAANAPTGGEFQLAGCQFVIVERLGDMCVPGFDVGFRERRVTLVLSEYVDLKLSQSVLKPGTANVRFVPGAALESLIETADAQQATSLGVGQERERLLSDAETRLISDHHIKSMTQTTICDGATLTSLPRDYETVVSVPSFRAEEIADDLISYMKRFCALGLLAALD